MPSTYQSEPAVVNGAVGTLIAGVIAVLVAFHVHIDSGQTQAIMGLFAAVMVLVPIATGFLTRRKVTPVPPAPKLTLTADELAAYRRWQASQPATPAGAAVIAAPVAAGPTSAGAIT